METLFDPHAAVRCSSELALRVYTARLLGRHFGLALQGGGSASVKIAEDGGEALYVMSGDAGLGAADAVGLAPLRLAAVRRLIESDRLDNGRLAAAFGTALKRPGVAHFPIETLLHAILPCKWVEHTQADAVLALADTFAAATTLQPIQNTDQAPNPLSVAAPVRRLPAQ